MIVQSACQVRAPRFLARESLSRPQCPRCCSVLLVAESSRFDAGAANAVPDRPRLVLRRLRQWVRDVYPIVPSLDESVINTA